MKAKVGLVLSGGMGKGAYQIGALRAITEYIKPEDFTMVSASSVGAVNAYSFLIGHLDDMTGIWESANPEGRRQFITYVLKSTFIQDTIETIAGWGGSVPCPLYIPLLNLAKRKLSYYDFSAVSQDDIRSYLTASVAMPFYNKGVKIADEVLYDGAVVDNIPVYPLIDKDLDYIICICFENNQGWAKTVCDRLTKEKVETLPAGDYHDKPYYEGGSLFFEFSESRRSEFENADLSGQDALLGSFIDEVMETTLIK